MNKKTIITALLALAALTGQGQTFTPVVEDSIDFVITGKTTAQTDSVAWFKVAPFGGGTMKVPLTGGAVPCHRPFASPYIHPNWRQC